MLNVTLTKTQSANQENIKNARRGKPNMGCFWLDEWRECDDCPYFSECPDSDDNREEST